MLSSIIPLKSLRARLNGGYFQNAAIDKTQHHHNPQETNVRMKRLQLFSIFCMSIFLTACATRPAIDGDTYTARQIDTNLIEQQQQSLAQLEQFGLQGNVAFFDDAADVRDAARFNWNKTPDATNFRLYHQLAGTLARLEQSENLSVLIDRDGNRYEGSDLNVLLLQHTGMVIPFSLLNQAITGAEPDARLRQKRWYANGALATYEAEFTLGAWAEERWVLEFGDYRSVPYADQPLLLPHRIEASRNNIRVHLRISRWRLEVGENAN
ncbi:outer membrane lipoprotein LolB [Aliidiomarina shirensis]|uniref:Outer-membrane lipoprotein LolB n=1 Tax=Aliidiomarina shirensis TaxID=1048642 RepID=A0A432WY63_9GAMM|nr:lipoprotein insertase outer membrane protein LolB [Aliidiomarina shirensis]RUO38699.1 outer membrane lipoprotein LolB [Aliidiomarina shirensis]